MSKLLDQVRHAIRLKHYSLRTEEAYLFWIKKYIHFHNLRHPQEMREEEIRQFLTHLAVTQNVAAATQNQAFAALLFLYRNVLIEGYYNRVRLHSGLNYQSPLEFEKHLEIKTKQRSESFVS